MTLVIRRGTIDFAAGLPQAEIGRRAAAVARAERDKLIASGRAAPSYRTYVDGQQNRAEEAVNVRGGTILYRFNALGEAASYALEYARTISPTKSGRYARSWFLVVNGTVWRETPRAIPAGAEVMLTNDQPYSRKIDKRARAPSAITELVRQATRRRFPNLEVGRTFVNISGSGSGNASPVPYVLKGTKTRKSGKRISGRSRGDRMTYPAVSIAEKGR